MAPTSEYNVTFENH